MTFLCSSCPSVKCVCRCTVLHVSPRLTNGAVFARPALVAVTLALTTDSVVDAAWVTVPLLTFWSCPAFLAVTHTADARAVGTAVHHTHLCRKTKSRRDVSLLFFFSSSVLSCFRIQWRGICHKNSLMSAKNWWSPSAEVDQELYSICECFIAFSAL